MFYVISVAVHGSVIIRPNHTSTMIGQSVQFDCELNFGNDLHVMAWYFGEKRIYYDEEGSQDYPEGKTKYSVKELPGHHYILEIKDLTTNDGGTYSCLNQRSKAEATLLILGE